MQIQWFYQSDDKSWTPFDTFDNSILEAAIQSSLKGAAQHKVILSSEKLYEANLDTKTLYPIYWKGASIDIRRHLLVCKFRGTWYYCDEKKCRPLEEKLAQQIEEDYLKHSLWLSALDENQDQKISATVEQTSLTLSGELTNHVLVYRKGILNKLYIAVVSPTTSTQMKTAIKTIISGKVNSDTRKDYWLIRGYEFCYGFKSALPNPRLDQPFDHLILVVHG